MENAIICEVRVVIKPAGQYANEVYRFERTKVLAAGSQKEIDELLLGVAEAVSRETREVSQVGLALTQQKSARLELQEKRRELGQDKPEEVDAEVI